MIFLYLFSTVALYIILSFILTNVIYKFYKENDRGRKSIIEGFVKGRTLGYSSEDNVIANAIGLMLAGFIMSSLFSLLYFVASLFILYITFGV